MEAPTTCQDSTSVISFVTKGRGVVRTKHLQVGMNLAKEAVVENRVCIVYLHTSNMMQIADDLTKPLEGKVSLHSSEPYEEIKWHKTTGGHWIIM